jgi:hypothetical protein
LVVREWIGWKLKHAVLNVKKMNECRWSQTVENEWTGTKVAVDLEGGKQRASRNLHILEILLRGVTRFRAGLFWCPLFHATGAIRDADKIFNRSRQPNVY